MSTIFLDRNESQYGPSPKCLEVLRSARVEDLSQYTRDFTRGVKSRVSERISKHLNISESKVVLGYGSEGLLKMAIHRFLGKDQTLLVPSQSWWYYKAIADEVGGKTQEFSLSCEKDRFHYQVEELLSSIEKHQPRVILIASPNNPTGNSLSDSDLVQILQAASDSIVIVDEAYWGFVSKKKCHIKELTEKFPNVLFLRTFSKFYSLAGVRMGYAVGGAWFEGYEKYTTRYLGYSQIAENLVLAALDDVEYYEDVRKKFESDKALFYRALEKAPGVQCYHSDASFLLIRIDASLVRPLQKEFNELNFKIKFFDEKGLENHLRLSLGTEEQNRKVLEKILKVSAECRTQGTAQNLLHEKAI